MEKPQLFAFLYPTYMLVSSYLPSCINKIKNKTVMFKFKSFIVTVYIMLYIVAKLLIFKQLYIVYTHLIRAGVRRVLFSAFPGTRFRVFRSPAAYEIQIILNTLIKLNFSLLNRNFT